MTRTGIVALSAFVCGELVASVPTVDVTGVVQDDRRIVSVNYSLSASAVVTVDFLTNGVSLLSDEATLSGDLGWVATGGSGKTICWNPRKDLPKDLRIADVTVRVQAYNPARLPDYMAVDPRTGWRQFYATSNDVPGGVLANADYRAKLVLLRRIPASWKEQMLGKASSTWGGTDDRRTRRAVMPTNDFYMSVFPVTRGQLARAYGWTRYDQDPFTLQPDKETDWRLRPADGVGYEDLRGTEKGGIDWPLTGDAVADNSVLAVFRQTGILFDLPTDAQYEVACRCGTDSDFYDAGGRIYLSDDVAAVHAKRIGWYAANWADDPMKPTSATAATFTHVVGQKLPNNYGLYDMCGNLRSFCRDWWMEKPGDAKDGYAPEYYEPKGPTKAQSEPVSSVYRRVSHGCAFDEGVTLMQTSVRNPESVGPNRRIGFRLVCPAVNGGSFVR